MNSQTVATVEGVTLVRRGHHLTGTLILAPHHLVFSFVPPAGGGVAAGAPREIWVCYPVIERVHKARGSLWIAAYQEDPDGAPSAPSNYAQASRTGADGGESNSSEAHILNLTGDIGATPPAARTLAELTPNLPAKASHTKSGRRHMDHYSSSHIRIQCKDFTYYSFDFANDGTCTDVFHKLSHLITQPKLKGSIRQLYAFAYQPNVYESSLSPNGWSLYDPLREYTRLGLLLLFWRASSLNEDYTFCPLYPHVFVAPATISDNVLKHAGKFRSKQRIPAVVYRHRAGANANVIARCAQPLMGLKLQNRSLQDEKLIGEIFATQRREAVQVDGEVSQPHRNLIVDLRPLTNAMAQHALGAGTENIDNYRGRSDIITEGTGATAPTVPAAQVDKIFCNIDNIHVMRDSLTKLSSILNDLDRFPRTIGSAALQQALTKTQWLHRLSIILQSVDRIAKLVHLNNTNVVIHCSDGWDRTSQVSALLQLCLDPYYRSLEGFMVLVEKEWVSFGFKFATRSDHGGCIGAKMSKVVGAPSDADSKDSEQPQLQAQVAAAAAAAAASSGANKVSSFLQRAATHIKNTAVLALNADFDDDGKMFGASSYSGSSERSPIFHQFLDCVYQLLRQHPARFEFNSRFLKRLFYHHYSCQYGTFLCNSERESKVFDVSECTTSVWDYFNSRRAEFVNPSFKPELTGEGVMFFNYTDIKWWCELYGRSDEEMNGLSNSLDRKFAKMGKAA